MIKLTKKQVVDAIAKAERGVDQYCRLQARLMQAGFADDPTFRKKFNHFYRVRRGPEWQDVYFRVLASEFQKPQGFASVLSHLQDETGRLEVSFASKLVATVNPSLPVIDSFVLKNLGIRLPLSGSPDRFARVVEIYGRVHEELETFAHSDAGKQAINCFLQAYPGSSLTPLKVVDFLLWQTREAA